MSDKRDATKRVEILIGEYRRVCGESGGAQTKKTEKAEGGLWAAIKTYTKECVEADRKKRT